MGKRGDKRRARKKRRHPRVDVDGFQIGPLTVQRFGKNVVQRVDTTHPDYAEFRKMMDAQVADMPNELARLRGELRDLFAPFDAFDVVAYLWLMNVPSDPETYRESSDEGILAIPEVGAAILIERDSRKGSDPMAIFWDRSGRRMRDARRSSERPRHRPGDLAPPARATCAQTRRRIDHRPARPGVASPR